MEPLKKEDIVKAINTAILDKERGLGNYLLSFEENSIDLIADLSSGDLRKAFNILEMATLTTEPNSEGLIHVTLKDAEESIQQKALSFDEQMYYDMLSAFCKSLRGSDANAALYYMQRLI